MKKNLFTLSLIWCFSISALAQEMTTDHLRYLGYIYQQEKHQLDDPKGDLLLLHSVREVQRTIKANLLGKEEEVVRERNRVKQELLQIYPQYEELEETKNVVVHDYNECDLSDVPIVLEGHQAPFKIKNLTLMMKQVISEENQRGLPPKRGEIHEWSKETHKNLKNQFPIFARMSKLLVALSRGVTSRYMISGTEEELKDYILSQPENSISLEQMFRASYRINKGDVYLTLLTIENVLSRFWIHKDRSRLAITTRLKDITNYNYKTDKFGSWYHLFGMLLYGYAEGGLKARFVGNIETVGSQILGRFKDERQETYINDRGGPVGARLRRFIEKDQYQNFEQDPRYLEEDFYMNLDEDFSQRVKRKIKLKTKNAQTNPGILASKDDASILIDRHP